jgi:glycosyltransferase involved in cell wall biosynthesis
VRPLTVAYDEQIFLLQEVGGISRYFSELVNQFQTNPELGIHPVFVSTKSRNKHRFALTNSNGPTPDKGLGWALGQLLLSIFDRAKLPNGVHVLHLTFYLPGFLNRFPAVPKVVTLFDMIPESFPGKRLWNPHFRKRQYLENASGIVSISESSTEEMRSKYGLNSPVLTTYLGVSSDFRPGLEKPVWAPQNYLLFVGKRGGYKNWGMAASAFAAIARDFPEVTIQLAGGGPLTKRESKLLKQLGIEGRVSQRGVPDSELPNLYSNTIGLLYPSEREGFGLPLVEAMASGVPIIASDVAINREICGDGAKYFDLLSLDSFASELEEVIQGGEGLKSIRKAAITRAKTYTWYKCAAETAKVYRSVIQEERIQGE